MTAENNFIENCIDYISGCYQYSRDLFDIFINSPIIIGLGIRILTWYSGFIEFGKRKIRQYPFIEDKVDGIVYFFSYIKSVGLNFRIEPIDKNWMLTCSLETDSVNQTSFGYSETYFKVPNGIFYNSRIISQTFETDCDYSMDKMNCVPNVSEILNVLKYEDQYITYFCTAKKQDKLTRLQLPLSQSDVCFLTIEYVHPAMEKGIFIELDNGYYVANNCLFTPLFIRRCLEYQTASFFFDMDYELKLMDGDLNIFILTSRQWIQLSEKGYSIKGAN